MKLWRTVAAAVSMAGLLAAAVAAQAGKPAPLVNPNTASAQDLASLPHMTDALAKAVIARRPFPNMTAVNALLSASLKKEQLTELYGRMFIPIDLNTASRDEILLIPGVGNRMAREFEEYRPYKMIEQFRREIGKYVDKEEVARLERYVTIK